MSPRLEITYTRSAIGRSKRQRDTVAALGLRKLNETVSHEDNPTLRGMLKKVEHLLTWREVGEGAER